MKNDDDVWSSYTKGVKKIKKAPSKSRLFPRKRESDLTRLRDEGSNAADSSRLIPASASMTSGDEGFKKLLDRRIEKNLRSGEIAIEARLDLHGKTQAEAFDALGRFITTHVKAERRHLLVITGKGPAKAGVLRTNLPRWLETLPEYAQILALRPAAPKHGGDGAFYVLLKKKRRQKTW